MMVFRFLFFLIVTLIGGCSSPKEKELNIQNPVIQGEFPDPSVIEVDGTYYACGTSNDWAPVYPIYESKDLVNWTFKSYVFQKAPDWTKSSFWAPELYYKNGTFYCYYTAKRKDGVSCIGVATSENLDEGFTDHGVMIEWGSECIDAFVYNEEGQLYVTWKAYGLNPERPIQILGSQLTSDGLKMKGEVFEIVTAEADNWERGGIEGQSIIKKGEYLYLIYSGAACCGGGCDYKVGVARSKSMTGPWEKYDGNPILTDFGPWKCPGHGTPIHTQDGNWFYLYHAYQKKGFPYMGRSGLLSQLFWDESNAWPYFKAPSERGAKIEKEFVDINDEFDAEKLADHWRWDLATFNPTTEMENGKLMLSSSKKNLDPIGTTLCLIPEKADYEIEVELSPQDNAKKGLVIYGTAQNFVGLGLEGGRLILFEVREGNYNEFDKIDGISSDQVQLKCQVREGHQLLFSYRFGKNQWSDIKASENNYINGDFLSFWQWGVKPGIFSQGSEAGSIDSFVLRY